MKKFFLQMLIGLMLGGPLVSFGSAVSLADSVTESTGSSIEAVVNSDLMEDIDSSTIEPIISSEETVDTTTEMSSESVSEENSEVTAESSSNEQVVETEQETTESTEESVEQTELTVTFQTDEDSPFANGETSIELSKKVGENLSEKDIPKLEQSDKFIGWILNEEELSNEDLVSLDLNEDIVLQANIETASRFAALADSYLEISIKEVINEANKNQLILIPNPITGENFGEYPRNEDGLRQALFDMYQAEGEQEYVLYIGDGGSLTVSTSLSAKTISEPIDTGSITFYALQNKVSRLIITGSSEDPITNSTTLTTGSSTLSFQGGAYFGTDIVIRNLNYRGTNIYMNGNSLSLNGGATGDGFYIFGGTSSGNVNGNPTITINTTGTGNWYLYGGNQDGGILTGNPSIIVNNTVGGIYTISGGANKGTVNGNITTKVTDMNGTLTNFYGGGVGDISNKADVNGDVTNIFEIQNTNSRFRFNNYYGGVLNGNINGSITNELSGGGGWATRGPFIGGSGSGDIKSEKNPQAITNYLDASQYSTFGPNFVGANKLRGTVIGNISNTVKAGANPLQGGIGNFDGGGGPDAVKLSKASLGASNESTYDSYSPEVRASLAFNAAQYKIIGDIHSHLVSGSFGNQDLWRTTAAGVGGYVEGNATIEVGTRNEDGTLGGDGLVYNGQQRTDSELYYSNSRHNFANQRDFDIAGGGYVVGRDTWPIYIYGDTHTIVNNGIVRRTYGGLFSGVVEGNTNATLNAGIVDTLEGTGYEGGRVFGNGTATVYNGQVDWFLSGGGWNDKKTVGNVSVTVFDGVINASMGASYGFFSDHTVTGNSEITVYGGDFSGKPREGASGFSGGITNVGSLLGDASLTLDLRNYGGKFKLPEDTSISGGRPPGNQTTLGTDESNSITLNIYTASGEDSLNGAEIFGDGGPISAAGNGKSGNITMNIQAEGSNIGKLYATNYPNVSNGRILKDVLVNVQGAKSIAGISGGNASSASNLTNTVVNNSDNQIRMNFGVDVDKLGDFQEEPINVTDIGIVNFTELRVTNGVKLMANGGNIKNGSSATAANHGTNYYQFGDIHLSKDAGIGVSASNMISGAKLTVEDAGTIQSPPGAGKAIFTDFETPDLSKDSLTWLKTTTGDTGSLVASEAETFGSVSAYQVLTINPTIDNAKAITPQNFSGYEKATGKYFIGDNDTTKTGSGYGIAIPGSKIEYEVEAPIAEAEGSITHDVTAVKEGNEPLTIGAWGTDLAGVEVQKGTLLIPYTAGNVPTLSFIPERDETGSWLYSAVIETSKVSTEAQTIEEQDNSDDVEWTSPDGEYEYTIKVKYSNEAELTAKNIIIPEQQAASLTKEEALEAISAVGRPFFKDSITDEELANIQQALADDVYRKHPVSLEVGTSADNQLLETVNLVVVNDESTIAEDGTFAVYAKAARMTLEEANALADEEALAQYTAATTIFADNRENVLPIVDQTNYNAIKNATEAELVKNVATAYSYQESELTLEKIINVMIAGELKLVSAPTDFDFGEQTISASTQTYWPTITGDLVVKDTRGPERSTWRLTVREEQVLTDGEYSLDNTLSFEKDGHEQFLNGGDAIVEETQLSDNNDYVVSQNWGETQETGLKLTVPVEKQRVGDYSGTLSWQLADVPGNP